MEENRNNIQILDFGAPEKEHSIIKVIGVGGGGGNAVNHMYREGIHDVTFVLCNTDNQALNDSPVPVHLQLGKEGLGAGNKPEKAREAAEESLEDIRSMLSDGTKMAFITAGMGGGTGTGAAPVIARVSKELGILTVGIVTIPFRFEGDRKIDQALDGVEEMSKHVDALLVINNERLREIYPELSVLDAFGKADDTLSVAAKSIAEIITVLADTGDDRCGTCAGTTTHTGGDEGHLRAVAEHHLRSLKRRSAVTDDGRDERRQRLHGQIRQRLRDQVGTRHRSRTGQESQGHHPRHRLRHRGRRWHERPSEEA